MRSWKWGTENAASVFASKCYFPRFTATYHRNKSENKQEGVIQLTTLTSNFPINQIDHDGQISPHCRGRLGN